MTSDPDTYAPQELSDWELELRHILAGSRAHVVEQIGEVRAYVDSLVDRSSDPSLSRIELRAALERITADRGGLPSDVRSLGIVLHLVTHYCPEPALTWLLHEFSTYGGLHVRVGLRKGDASAAEIDLKGLVALGSYFPAGAREPDRRWPSFKLYAQIMVERADDPVVGGYALKRLLEIGALDLGSEGVRARIEKMPSVLEELVDYCIRDDSPHVTRRRLAQLHGHVIASGREAEASFDRALKRIGAHFHPVTIEEGRPSLPSVSYGRGENLEFTLSDEEAVKFLELQAEKGRAKLPQRTIPRR
jgi:hypothetical protein